MQSTTAQTIAYYFTQVYKITVALSSLQINQINFSDWSECFGPLCAQNDRLALEPLRLRILANFKIKLHKFRVIKRKKLNVSAR